MASLAGADRPGKEQSRESHAAHERGRARTSSSQVVPKRTKSSRGNSTSSFGPVGHKPGLLSDFGGVACWNAAMRTKEKAGAEAPPMQCMGHGAWPTDGMPHLEASRDQLRLLQQEMADDSEAPPMQAKLTSRAAV
mmetsp:Transcript_301/g.801  ORF Transcript_301/g.801 Transcript_301/m.801 type:complete len:136 (-) Transcript_301:203-610(-)|eukprot:CAMPEP_0118812206 /NCGR_PEP_ID=MMETSP1162-20130426/2144_1 /TAXON_ID=33656 /ORGANISM="Phaeocystis Sp, Strain CCMP2710" /LENGTH=135 /DNA_ID=CAMNT_0006741911 /DNA_START=57 /DNA_END=464 /DNA_ORIENTATION=-